MVAVLTLGVGIGARTAIFRLIHTVSLKPSVPRTRPIEARWWRTWWAHFEFTRINTAPNILQNKIEDLREAGAYIDRRFTIPR
jgi:hypothetical protein